MSASATRCRIARRTGGPAVSKLTTRRPRKPISSASNRFAAWRKLTPFSLPMMPRFLFSPRTRNASPPGHYHGDARLRRPDPHPRQEPDPEAAQKVGFPTPLSYTPGKATRNFCQARPRWQRPGCSNRVATHTAPTFAWRSDRGELSKEFERLSDIQDRPLLQEYMPTRTKRTITCW